MADSVPQRRARSVDVQGHWSWWRRQLTTLLAAESCQPSHFLRQRPNISFERILGVLVPEARRDHFALNIGGADGVQHDPVYPLFHNESYDGLVVEAREEMREALLANMAMLNTSGRLHVAIERLVPHRVGPLLAEHAVPREFDALKVDIDSIDLAILRAVLDSAFRPKVIAIEINPDIPPPIQWQLEYKEGLIAGNMARGAYGASPDAVYRLLSTLHDYSLVAIELQGEHDRRLRPPVSAFSEHNMWFVRTSLLAVEPSAPSLSWWGMVRLYWGQVEATYWFKNRHWPCLHFHGNIPCPLALLRDMAAWMAQGEAALRTHAEQSAFLAQPRFRARVLTVVSRLDEQLSPLCEGRACPTTVGAAELLGQPCSEAWL